MRCEPAPHNAKNSATETETYRFHQKLPENMNLSRTYRTQINVGLRTYHGFHVPEEDGAVETPTR